MKLRDDLTASFVRGLLNYDPSTGQFSLRRSSRRSGYMMIDGHVQVWINGKAYLAHRLAWLYVAGLWPSQNIDHIDGNPSNNRISNLRLASHSENMRNRKIHKNNACGFKGVYFDKIKEKFSARINVDGKRIHLGRFKTPQEAHGAYCAAARKYHGEFARAA